MIVSIPFAVELYLETGETTLVRDLFHVVMEDFDSMIESIGSFEEWATMVAVDYAEVLDDRMTTTEGSSTMGFHDDADVTAVFRKSAVLGFTVTPPTHDVLRECVDNFIEEDDEHE